MDYDNTKYEQNKDITIPQTDNIEYTKIIDANLLNDSASTQILIRYNNILYGKSFAVIDYAGSLEKNIGIIDKLIDEQYVPKLNCETNSEELLNSHIANASADNMIIISDNEAILFYKINEN